MLQLSYTFDVGEIIIIIVFFPDDKLKIEKTG